MIQIRSRFSLITVHQSTNITTWSVWYLNVSRYIQIYRMICQTYRTMYQDIVRDTISYPTRNHNILDMAG